jgi:acyl-CoA thioesterase-1
VAFFFKGIADTPIASSLFQADRIHPNEDAQPLLLVNVWTGLAPMIQ